MPARFDRSRKYRPMMLGLAFAAALVIVILAGAMQASGAESFSPREADRLHPAVAPLSPAVRVPKLAACDRQHPGECRRAIAYWRRQAHVADAAAAWQRKQRWRAKALQVREVTADAIRWAAEKYTRTPAAAAALERQMTGIGTCESHLWLWATNGKYMSWAQLSPRHRSDPVIERLTWRDPYAVADHVARYLLANGEGEWQCVSTGGLRW